MVHRMRIIHRMGVILIISFLTIFPLFSGCKVVPKPLNLIIVWHNHQPFYKDPVANIYILPWVRLHGAKDYYRMPEIVSKYPDAKVTFDLSGSLINQIKDYINGAKDRNLILSEKSADLLTEDEKFEMLQIPGGFFDINWDHILKKTPMYKSILNKREDTFKKYGSPLDKSKIVNSLTNQDYLNLQTVFNLFWLDTNYVQNDSSLSKLYNKAMNGENFTESDKKEVLDAQLNVISKIFDEYKKLSENGQIELVTTPFAHSISALLVDFGFNRELTKQIERANKLFNEVFGFSPKGTWASECAINDGTLKLFNENSWNWTISDADNLDQLGVDIKKELLSKYIPYNVDRVTTFFRDKYLSDGISFRYSGKSVNEALKDVEDTLLNLQKENKDGNLVYTIALDGENAWEYYENDGNDFLNGLYKKLSELQKKGKIRLITPSMYIKKYGKGNIVTPHKVQVLNLKNANISDINSYSNLPAIEIQGEFGESSWVNPTLDTWIGERQENVAWVWLKEVIEEFYKKENDLDEKTKEEVIDNLLKAEGSDWFWWYGSDQNSGNDPSFDRLFKIYLENIYKLLDENTPGYLFGNYFPDGFPYTFESVSLEENKPLGLPLLNDGLDATIEYLNGNILINFSNAPKNIIVGVFNGKTLNPFFESQKKPSSFTMSPFPYEVESIGIPIDFEIHPKVTSSNSSKVIIDTKGLDTGILFITLASFDKNSNLIKLSKPMQVRLPIKIQGEVIGELLDEEGDDNGPGTYTYPLNEIFKNKGRLFDLVSFTMLDSGENYIMQFKMRSIGGNPWNGPNGISFQILEFYLDYKDGGSKETINEKGPMVQLDPSHKWDVALRIAGWSYGNFIAFPDGKSVQGELGIQVDPQKNLITVTLPKKYVELSSSYKPYIAILSGSQDGYSPGYFRTVNVTASEWAGGGANSEVFNASVSPNVYDIFVLTGKTQQEILSSYDVKSKQLAIIPYLPLQKSKPAPKLTGTISIKVDKVTLPESDFQVICEIKNIGKGYQKDNSGSEFTLKIPDFVNVEDLKASEGKLSVQDKMINWNGSVVPAGAISITLNCNLTKDIPNGLEVSFQGIVSYDAEASSVNSVSSKVKGNFLTRYPVKLEISFDSNYFLRNGVKILFSASGEWKSKFVSTFNDISTPLESIMKAIGANYEFDNISKKITIIFIGNKYEHWVGQNKALLNGTAIPLVPEHPEIRSFISENEPLIPLSAIAYVFKFTYNVDNTKQIAYLNYLP